MDTTYFISITGLDEFYGDKPFEVNSIVKLTKEPSRYDAEAIKVEMPYIGTIGYVSNSPETVCLGTMSAGRIYDKIDDYAFAQILFITQTCVIALVLTPEELEHIIKFLKIVNIKKDFEK